MPKTRRMGNIFGEDGKSITSALDGHYFSTNTGSIDNTIGEFPKMIESGIDAVLVTYGLANTYATSFADVSMLIRADLSIRVFNPSVPNTVGLAIPNGTNAAVEVPWQTAGVWCLNEE